ncbi:helix-turn-helix domain-containing protein [Serpentinimonas barnesii]|uniref:helix-turn-helix domain-containing protein n=1 Tax=Serpentinimonas barnesii TaxID=1458427 RepID=UPI000496FDDA|nr:helix-turn-helix domain-containing protein [Serpentinimonas barnesii]
MQADITTVMTVQEVADHLRVNQRTVYRLAATRKLPSVKVGAHWRLKRTDIERWMAGQLEENASKETCGGGQKAKESKP